jgi:hypothetical protein
MHNSLYRFPVNYTVITFCILIILPLGGKSTKSDILESMILDTRQDADSKIEMYKELYSRDKEHNFSCLKALIHQVEKEFRQSEDYSVEYDMYTGMYPDSFHKIYLDRNSTHDLHWSSYFLGWSVEKQDKAAIEYMKGIILHQGYPDTMKALAANALLIGGYGNNDVKGFVETTIQHKTGTDAPSKDFPSKLLVAIATSKMKDRKAITVLKDGLYKSPPASWKNIREDAFNGLMNFDDATTLGITEKAIRQNPGTTEFREARFNYGRNPELVSTLFMSMGGKDDNADQNLRLFCEFLAENGSTSDLEMLINKLAITSGKERLLVAHAIKRILKD